MGKQFKIAMFITSFLPLWISILFINLVSLFSNSRLSSVEIFTTIVILASNLASSLIIYFSLNSLHKGDYKKYKIIDATLEQGFTTNFLISYILPLFVFNFAEWTDLALFCIYFITLLFLSYKNNNVYANLIFEFMDYKFYSCILTRNAGIEGQTISSIILSKNNLSSQIGNTIEIAPLNKPFYIMRILAE